MVAPAAHLSRFAKSHHRCHSLWPRVSSLGCSKCPNPVPNRRLTRAHSKRNTMGIVELVVGTPVRRVVSAFDLLLLATFSSFSFRVLDWSIVSSAFSPHSSLPRQPFLTVVFCFPVLPPYILSSALPLRTHQCRSVVHIRYFINYGTSFLFSIHVSNLSFVAEPLHPTG